MEAASIRKDVKVGAKSVLEGKLGNRRVCGGTSGVRWVEGSVDAQIICVRNDRVIHLSKNKMMFDSKFRFE